MMHGVFVGITSFFVRGGRGIGCFAASLQRETLATLVVEIQSIQTQHVSFLVPLSILKFELEMIVKVAWSSLYLQFSSFNFLMSGQTGDLLCLRFFLSWAYIWLLVNELCGFPSWGEFFAKDPFVLHIDALLWTIVTLYSHGSRFIGIVLNERHVELPPESLPLWRMMYRNGGLSELLFQQFVWPRFELVEVKKGDIIDEDALFIVLDGVATAQVKLKDGQVNNITLSSGEVINVKYLHLFRQAECEAFADQTVKAVALTDMTLYKCTPEDIEAIATQPQTTRGYQGLLIFVLTRIAERAILNQEIGFHPNGITGRNAAFLPLEPWEEPSPLHPGSGKALSRPWQHFTNSFWKSFRPPFPIIKWIPGLRHAFLPAPHFASKHKATNTQVELDETYQRSSLASDVADEETALLREGAI